MENEAALSAPSGARRRSAHPSDEVVRSVHRAFSILAAFGQERPKASLTQLAQLSGLPTTTVARLLATLESLNFIRRLEGGSYGLGVRILQLGLAARETFDIIDVAEPALAKLNRLTGENSNLAVRIDEEHFVYVRQLMSRHPVRHATWVGHVQPIKGTANGAALLGQVGAGGYAVTRKTIEPDISAVAAPVRGADGEIVAAISVTGPTYRTTDAKLLRFAKLVTEAARSVSRTLGAV